MRVEQLSRRGYRFAGRATIHAAPSLEYTEAVRRVYGDASRWSAPTGVVLLTVERAAPLASPAYWRGNDEEVIRAEWRKRRAALDATFEEYISHVGAARVGDGRC